jgi:hypothetical protein
MTQIRHESFVLACNPTKRRNTYHRGTEAQRHRGDLGLGNLVTGNLEIKPLGICGGCCERLNPIFKITRLQNYPITKSLGSFNPNS